MEDLLVLYTWQDVEKILFLDKQNWPENWKSIEVFSSEIIIYTKDNEENAEKKQEDYLRDLFKQYYYDGEIIIEVTKTRMEVITEVGINEEKEEVQPFPLFKDFLYVRDEYEADIEELPGVPVTAFHSYKGGVGRTLSLITYVRDVIEEFGADKKVLIVDSDIEAPGLTWLGKEQNGNYNISYLDVLSIIGAKGNDDEIIENISHKIENIILTFHTDKVECQQFFLPTYRKEEQMLDIYANPERIMTGEQNKYIIVDVLSKIGKVLGVDMVLVDLRAGVSEYSAPFLFDPRVNKLIVTSTSNQSIYGTNLLMKQITKQKRNSITNILLTMVMRDSFVGKIKSDVYQILLQGDSVGNTDDMDFDIKLVDAIVEIEKSDAMIHLGGLKQICDSLNTAGKITEPLKSIVREMLQDNEKRSQQYDWETIEKFRNNLHQITNENVTAEGSDFSNLLVTRPVLQLGSFTREVPKINILGAKGSGKTYLYKQMVASKEWKNFLAVLNKENHMSEDVLICPVLCTEDRNKLQSLLSECRKNCLDKISGMSDDSDILSRNEDLVRDAIEHNYTEKEWQKFWDSLILRMISETGTWQEVNHYLGSIHKKVIFLIDGLETLFTDVTRKESEKKGIRTLCKGVLNRLYESQADNIGIIIFLRKDIAELAMDVNFEQFKNQYQQYELNWAQKDALQLAWKLADRAADMSNLRLAEDEAFIYNATQPVIEEKLTRIWGKKMGPDKSKTAFTVRWVLASLSDFTGQLQARDIVRFLKFATEESNGGKTQYRDRFITPEDMKKSVEACSKEKLKEVEKEIHQLRNIFQVLRDVNVKDKQIPLNENVIEKLGIEDKKALERYGYLKEAEGEYYIPECIRYGLGYNKSKRGGIKLVSLLVSK